MLLLRIVLVRCLPAEANITSNSAVSSEILVWATRRPRILSFYLRWNKDERRICTYKQITWRYSLWLDFDFERNNKTKHRRTRHCARVYRVIFTYTFHLRGKSQIYVNCVAQWYRIAFIEFENSNKAQYSTTWRFISNRRDAFEHFQQREGREREKQWETPPSLLV